MVVTRNLPLGGDGQSGTRKLLKTLKKETDGWKDKGTNIGQIDTVSVGYRRCNSCMYAIGKEPQWSTARVHPLLRHGCLSGMFFTVLLKKSSYFYIGNKAASL